MISLIITVLNEKDNLSQWFSHIKKQTILPDEIVIVDGGSTDGTWEWLQKQAEENKILRVFQEEGNISHGRNTAITRAQGDIIVATDAGCVYDNTWFQKITEPFLQKNASFVSTAFGPWLESVDNITKYLISAATTPAPREFKKDWLPSSRSVAFTKELWQNVGGYPEWIPICEDIIFDKKLIKEAGQPFFIRKPLVFWRPRKNFFTYFRQLFKYTKSDGHGKLNLERQLIRYAVYLISLVLIYFSIKISYLFLFILFFGLIAYINKFWRRWFEFTKKKNILYRLLGFFLVPVIVFLGDIAKMCGWPIGVLERFSGKIKFEKY